MMDLIQAIVTSPLSVGLLVLLAFYPFISGFLRRSIHRLEIQRDRVADYEYAHAISENKDLRKLIDELKRQIKNGPGPYRSPAFQNECNCPCTGKCSEWVPSPLKTVRAGVNLSDTMPELSDDELERLRLEHENPGLRFRQQ